MRNNLKEIRVRIIEGFDSRENFAYIFQFRLRADKQGVLSFSGTGWQTA